MNINLLSRAINIAAEAHLSQTDLAGAPYILHAIRVMNAGETDDEKIVGVLHDAIEDSNLKIEDLLTLWFPDHIVVALDHLTKRKGEQYRKYIERLSKNDLAVKVKLNDLEDNLDIRRFHDLTVLDVPRLNKYLKARRFLKSIKK